MRRKRLDMPGLPSRPSATARAFGPGMLGAIVAAAMLGLAATPPAAAQGAAQLAACR